MEGKELEMYKAENKNIKVTLADGEILEGYCKEFSSAYDNDPEEASITLENPVQVETGRTLYSLTEIMEHEIERIEYRD
ncbi:hypothetical protein AB9D59_00280 [Blautia producta]|uniref:hypothetical protein n=1 Tax=Blautia producta TaxID=33035 RepID=UPI0012DE1EEE